MSLETEKQLSTQDVRFDALSRLTFIIFISHSDPWVCLHNKTLKKIENFCVDVKLIPNDIECIKSWKSLRFLSIKAARRVNKKKKRENFVWVRKKEKKTCAKPFCEFSLHSIRIYCKAHTKRNLWKQRKKVLYFSECVFVRVDKKRRIYRHMWILSHYCCVLSSFILPPLGTCFNFAGKKNFSLSRLLIKISTCVFAESIFLLFLLSIRRYTFFGERMEKKTKGNGNWKRRIFEHWIGHFWCSRALKLVFATSTGFFKNSSAFEWFLILFVWISK